jgi:hypothetical protein
MELLERYLQSVGKYLPKGKRSDIVAELRANILEQVEDKEAELGRPLTIEEEEQILRQYGHPMLVATRYLPQQHLIGSVVFPYYWFTLKVSIPLALLAYTVAMSLSFASQPVTIGRIVGVFLGYPQIAINVAVWVTIVFAIMDFAQSKYVKNNKVLYAWNPRNLPALEPKGDSRSQSIFEVIMSGIGVLWLLSVPKMPFLMLGPAESFLKYIQPAPIWHTMYWSFVGLLAVQWLIEIVALFNSSWRRVRPILGLAGQAIGLVIIYLLLQTSEYVVLTEAGRSLQQYQSIAETINTNFPTALKVAFVVSILQMLLKTGKLIWRRMNADTAMVQRNV